MAKRKNPERGSAGFSEKKKERAAARAAARAAGVPLSTYLARKAPHSKNLDEVTRRGLHLRHSGQDKKRTIAGRNPNEIATPTGGQPGWKRK